ncbi:MAG: hypothetical protein WCJ37_01150 [Syntrophus sp. (in: bacteria)]
MEGFKSIREWVDSTSEGKCDIFQFRKMAGGATIAGQWADYTYASGRPVSNFYATAPLASALIGDDKGIYVGENVFPLKKYIHRLTTMMGAGATVTTCQNVQLLLCDFLLSYPFTDMDAGGEDQDMNVGVASPVTLPNRYGNSIGVKMMLVAQGQTIGGGTFTITYTNSDGTPGRVTPLHYCAAAQPAGSLVQSRVAAAGVNPFITLQAGDKGVQSVQRIKYALANGGIAAIVLVKPLRNHIQMEECRTTTTSTLYSVGSPSETEMITSGMNLTEIVDGAVLGFIGQTMAGSIASSQLVGTIETIWR